MNFLTSSWTCIFQLLTTGVGCRDVKVDSEMMPLRKSAMDFMISDISNTTDATTMSLRDFKEGQEMAGRFLNTLKNIVRFRIFPDLKMIGSNAQLEDYQGEPSIGRTIMDVMHVPPKVCGGFWNYAKDKVNRYITDFRQGTNSALKKAFLGTSCCSYDDPNLHLILYLTVLYFDLCSSVEWNTWLSSLGAFDF